jgi:hypothetical protein
VGAIKVDPDEVTAVGTAIAGVAAGVAQIGAPPAGPGGCASRPPLTAVALSGAHTAPAVAEDIAFGARIFKDLSRAGPAAARLLPGRHRARGPDEGLLAEDAGGRAVHASYGTLWSGDPDLRWAGMASFLWAAETGDRDSQ